MERAIRREGSMQSNVFSSLHLKLKQCKMSAIISKSNRRSLKMYFVFFLQRDCFPDVPEVLLRNTRRYIADLKFAFGVESVCFNSSLLSNTVWIELHRSGVACDLVNKENLYLFKSTRMIS